MVHTVNPTHVFNFVKTNFCKSAEELQSSEDHDPLESNNQIIPAFQQPGWFGLECSLLANTYFNYFDMLLIVNNTRDVNYSTNTFDYFKKNYKSLNMVFTFITTWYRNRLMTKISLHLIPTIEIAELNKNSIYEDTLRQMYFSMSELNVFGLKYCEFSNFVTQIGYDNIGKSQYFTALDAVKYRQTLDVKKDANVEFPFVTFLLTEYRRSETYLLEYDDVIVLSWKGTKKSFQDIFTETTNIVSNPFYVYALYDVYFKFTFAVVYYEIVRLIKTLEMFFTTNINNRLYGQRWDKLVLDDTKFPAVYKTFVINLNRITNVFFNGIKKSTYDYQSVFSRDIMESIYVELKSLGVFVYTSDDKTQDRKSTKPRLQPRDYADVIPHSCFGKFSNTIKLVTDSSANVNEIFLDLMKYLVLAT